MTKAELKRKLVAFENSLDAYTKRVDKADTLIYTVREAAEDEVDDLIRALGEELMEILDLEKPNLYEEWVVLKKELINELPTVKRAA